MSLWCAARWPVSSPHSSSVCNLQHAEGPYFCGGHSRLKEDDDGVRLKSASSLLREVLDLKHSSSSPSCVQSGIPWTTMVFIMFLLRRFQWSTLPSIPWNTKHWDPNSLRRVCSPEASTNVCILTVWKLWERLQENDGEENPVHKGSDYRQHFCCWSILRWPFNRHRAVFAFHNCWTVRNCVLF